MDETEKIKIWISSGIPMVWDAHDARILREKHRIIGAYVGSLPRSPNQNNVFGRPLQLLNEEATLLKEKGLARLVESDRLNCPASDAEAKEYVEIRKSTMDGQVQLCLERRKRQLESLSSVIKERKRQKLMEKTTQKEISSSTEDQDERSSPTETIENSTPIVKQSENDSLDEQQPESSSTATTTCNVEEKKDSEISTAALVKPIGTKDCLLQVPTACPWIQNFQDAEWTFPSCDSEKLRYRTFLDWWEGGFYLTSGQKFGGDFLVYSADPHFCHAEYIAVCVNFTDNIHSLEFITKGRLGTSVKKKAMFCSLVDDEMVYTTMEWNGRRAKRMEVSVGSVNESS